MEGMFFVWTQPLFLRNMRQISEQVLRIQSPVGATEPVQGGYALQ